MCLSIKLSSRKKIATEDIHVFKVLKADYETIEASDNEFSESWLTTYRGYPVDFNKALEAKLKRSLFEVNAGVHSYETREDALLAIPYMNAEEADWFQWFGPPLYDRKVFKAIIPKGAEYYYGTHHYARLRSAGSYASSQLIILPEYA